MVWFLFISLGICCFSFLFRLISALLWCRASFFGFFVGVFCKVLKAFSLVMIFMILWGI